MESAVRQELLAAMCELFKAAHRGELGEMTAFRKLRELEFKLSPSEALAKRARIKARDEEPTSTPLIDELAEARSEKHAQRLRDYRARVAESHQIAADLSRLGSLVSKQQEVEDGRSAADSASGPGGPGADLVG